MKMIDMTGKSFGELLVVNISNKRRDGDGSILWNVKCSCGKEILLPKCLLIKYKSCGCKRGEYISKSIRKSLNRGGYGDIFATHWNTIKKNALSRDLEFKIDIKYVWELFEKQNKKCKITGTPIQFSTRCWSKDATASLDRIDSSKGYIKGNVQWVHKRINMMKQQYTTDEFFDWCKKVVKHNNL